MPRGDRRFGYRLAKAIGELRDELSPAQLRHSVSGKLTAVVLLTTVIALLVAGTAMLTHDLGVYRQSWASDLSTEASLLALSTAPALAFDDHNAADRALAALRTRPAVLVAGLYTENGSRFAYYARKGERLPPAQAMAWKMSPQIAGEEVEVIQRVVQIGDVVGTIYLRARYDVIGRVEAYLSIFAVVMLLSTAVALAFSITLRRIITRPLEAMTNIARQVVNQRDYSLRAQKTSRDEIGIVVDAFNSMLDEVQVRTRTIEESNAALKEEADRRQTAQAGLARANARLESSMAAAEIGSWVWDIRANEINADRNLASLCGLTDERDLSGDPALLRRHLDPDDLPRFMEAEATAVRTGVLTSTEFRLVRPDGTIRWVAARGKVQMDAVGEPAFLAGLLIDVTAQKVAEQALRQSEKLYRAIGESIDYGVWVCDEHGRNIYASESFLKLVGINQERCSDLGWVEALHPDDAQETIAAWRECVRTGGIWYREHRILGSDHTYHAILAQGVPIYSEDGRIAGWAGINLDISRLKRTEEALLEADRRKDEFLATLAHELRNPLAPIMHALKLLNSPQIEERQRLWGREVIGRQIQRMGLLLDDLLDVSRISRGRLQLKKEFIDLNSLIGTAVETARPLIDGKMHKLSVNVPRESIKLEADPLRLSQALSNLLTNAAKYTDAGGRISLRAIFDSDQLIISVEDTGIGLQPAAIPKLFEMFSQIDSAIDRAEGGLGIGLALVKGLVTLHGGTVQATSPGPGQGSRFSIYLPRSMVVREPAKIDAKYSVASVPSGRRCKVLIADDNRDAADTLALVLRLSGYEVVVAYSGLDAVEIATRERPEVAILDIGLPGLTGYEAANLIRQQSWGRELLLVAITGWGQADDKQQAKTAGFDHHLTKPADPDSIEQLLVAFLARRGGDRKSQADNGRPRTDQNLAR